MKKNGDICQKVWYVYKRKIIKYYRLYTIKYSMGETNEI